MGDIDRGRVVMGPGIASCLDVVDSEYGDQRPSVLGVSINHTLSHVLAGHKRALQAVV